MGIMIKARYKPKEVNLKKLKQYLEKQKDGKQHRLGKRIL
jgi:NADPH-dependent 7-cyano-7-deazaguanine reductase QueF